MKTYENIVAWQLAHGLMLEIYRCTSLFPKEEMYGLTSQMRRAALSVPANIVEGRARGTSKDFLKFLIISRGSLEEVEYFLYAAKDLKFLSLEDYKQVDEKASRLSAVLNGLINSIRKKIEFSSS